MASNDSKTKCNIDPLLDVLEGEGDDITEELVASCRGHPQYQALLMGDGGISKIPLLNFMLLGLAKDDDLGVSPVMTCLQHEIDRKGPVLLLVFKKGHMQPVAVPVSYYDFHNSSIHQQTVWTNLDSFIRGIINTAARSLGVCSIDFQASTYRKLLKKEQILSCCIRRIESAPSLRQSAQREYISTLWPFCKLLLLATRSKTETKYGNLVTHANILLQDPTRTACTVSNLQEMAEKKSQKPIISVRCWKCQKSMQQLSLSTIHNFLRHEEKCNQLQYDSPIARLNKYLVKYILSFLWDDVLDAPHFWSTKALWRARKLSRWAARNNIAASSVSQRAATAAAKAASKASSAASAAEAQRWQQYQQWRQKEGKRVFDV